ncbi:hypothetical protein [Parasphingorhabdus sp.]|uniref:hypothetical protein n=1 Tax=Parasphingorhabdus sp. TaxID=2709688 RepID=UPI0032EB88AF
MKQYRHYVGWGAIIVAALNFLPIPLPALPPMLTAPMMMLLPGIGPVLMMLSPMLLFAAGIGLARGWDGGRKLFLAWSIIGGLSALAGLQYIPMTAAIDLTVIGACLLVVLWGDWRRLLPG